MPTFTSHKPGTPSWADLMSPDIDAAVEFYRSLFGWEADEQVDDEGNRVYVMFRLDGKAVAGLGQQPPEMAGAPAIWNTYISVEDVDASVAGIEAAGGSVLMPSMQVFESGKMAVAADPSGAGFSMWQPMDHIGAEICNEPNTMIWNELMSRDADASKSFYTDLFGWTFEDAPGMDHYSLIGGMETPLGAVMPMPDEVPAEVPSHWMVYFAVENADTAAERVVAAGGAVVGQMAIPGVGSMAVCTDPAGGAFTLMQPEDQPES